ncbi:MAG: hypothetical protein J2P15_16100 [Micromonosporaceae bacterium]|nr:hypothetical protein [Micromonosporaceae bacterium]
MAGHQLIDAYLASLAGRLPADAVEELTDGLTETYARYRSAGLEPDAAAGTAITEFGEAEVVVAAFVRQAPGRRVASALLCSGPVVGVCWGTALLAEHAWAWPVPGLVRVAFAAALVTVVGMLALAATGRSYRRSRLAASAGLGLIGMDGAFVIATLVLAPPFVWPMLLAVPASLLRMVLTARVLPRLLTR